jgi:hypothetical protein
MVARAGQHVVPLQDLMEQDPVEEASEADPEQEPAGADGGPIGRLSARSILGRSRGRGCRR